MDFKDNSHFKDYLRKKEMETESRRAKTNRIVEERNRQSWLKYQDFLRNQFAVAAADYSLMTITGSAGVSPTATPTPSPTATPTPTATPIPSFVTTNLLYHYDFADSNCYNGSGYSVGDLSGNGNNAVLSPYGQPTFNASGWIDFPGSGNYALIGPDVIDGTNDNHTVEIWLKTDSIGSGRNIFSDRSTISIDSGTGEISSTYHFAGAQHFFYSAEMANVVSVGLWGGSSVLTSFTQAQATGQWFQLVRTYDGSNMKFYHNGTLINSRALTFDSPGDGGYTEWKQIYGNSDSTISPLSSAAGTFDGQMAVIRFYNDALTDSEVSQNYTYTSTDSRF